MLKQSPFDRLLTIPANAVRVMARYAGSTWPDLTGATVKMYIYQGANLLATWDVSVVTATGGSKKVRAEPTASETGALPVGKFPFSVWATLASGRKVALVPGSSLTVAPDYKP